MIIRYDGGGATAPLPSVSGGDTMNEKGVNVKRYERLQKRYDTLSDLVKKLEIENAELKKKCDEYAEMRTEFDKIYAEFNEAIEQANNIRDKYTEQLGELAKLRKQYANEFKHMVKMFE